MTRRFSLPGLGLFATVGVVLAFLGALLGASVISAQGATIDGGTSSFSTGSKGNVVDIKAAGLPSAGLGASDISVAFDSAVLSITACTAGDLGDVCNKNAPGGPARAAGFAATGETGTVVIAKLTFDCIGAAGSSSALTITVNEFVDATPGDPGAIANTVTDGTVTCVALPVAPPPTGSAPPPADSGSSIGWIIALAASLAVLGLGLGTIGARQLRRRV